MLFSTLAAPLLGQTGAAPTNRNYYELRWFHLRNGSHAPRMMSLLRDHWAPAAKKLEIASVGFFQPMIGEQGPSVLMFSAFPSADAAAGAFDRMMGDAEFAEAYSKANSPEPAFTRMETTLLRAFAGMPAVRFPNELPGKAAHIFEMRTYESNSMQSLRTKLEMFDGGEIGIFQRLGMQPVFFGEAIFGKNLPQLTYMLAFESLAARERLWKAFVADDEFTKLRTKPGYSDAEIVSTISNSILSPTGFSALR